jgi:hypothetical protein
LGRDLSYFAYNILLLLMVNASGRIAISFHFIFVIIGYSV